MYSLQLHRNLTSEKWVKYSSAQQILMIAAELNRAGNWIKKRQFEDVRRCYERAFELIDLTTEDPKWKKGLREIRRCRELLCELYTQPEPDASLNAQILSQLIALNSEAFNLMNG